MVIPRTANAEGGNASEPRQSPGVVLRKEVVDAQVELLKVLARNPTDKVAWHFLVQAAQCLKDGVPETWTGETVMITK